MPRTNTDGNLALLHKERSVLDTLLRAKNSRQKLHIVIPRTDEDGEELIIDFWVRPLSAGELRECQARASSWGQDPAAGGMITPVLDPFQEELANSYLVIMATIPSPIESEDGYKDPPAGTPTMWEMPEVLAGFDVADSAMLVDQVLLGYEKMAVVAKINDISGGSLSMAKLVESAKN